MRHSVSLMLVNGAPGDTNNATNWPIYAGLPPHAINSQAVECHDSWGRSLITNLVRYRPTTTVPSASPRSRETREPLGAANIDALAIGLYISNVLRRVGRVDDLNEDQKTTIATADFRLIDDRTGGNSRGEDHGEPHNGDCTIRTGRCPTVHLRVTP
jgi:hypothetical protein